MNDFRISDGEWAEIDEEIKEKLEEQMKEGIAFIEEFGCPCPFCSQGIKHIILAEELN